MYRDQILLQAIPVRISWKITNLKKLNVTFYEHVINQWHTNFISLQIPDGNLPKYTLHGSDVFLYISIYLCNYLKRKKINRHEQVFNT